MNQPPVTETPDEIFAREEEPVDGLHKEEAPPRARGSVLGWMRANLFSSIPNTLVTIACAALLVLTVPPLIQWAFVEAVWSAADPAQCRAAEGACWALIEQKHRFILFGL